MAQTQPATQTAADELFTSRLYAGITGSGKSTTIGHDIRRLLSTPGEEYRVADVDPLDYHDRSGLRDEYGTFGTLDDLADSQSELEDHIESTPYTRIDAGEANIWPQDKVLDTVAENVLPTIIRNDHPAVLVLDHFYADRLTDEITDLVSTGRKHRAALWAAHQYSTHEDTIESWALSGGEVVLHSEPDRMGRFDSTLSDDERDHVARLPVDELGDNPVLVGRPGQWRKDTIEAPQRDE